jgi:hypothetical protein
MTKNPKEIERQNSLENAWKEPVIDTFPPMIPIFAPPDRDTARIKHKHPP